MPAFFHLLCVLDKEQRNKRMLNKMSSGVTCQRIIFYKMAALNESFQKVLQLQAASQ